MAQTMPAGQLESVRTETSQEQSVSSTDTELFEATVAALAPRRHRIDSRHHWFPDLRALLQCQDLLRLMSRRQITVRYRQTVLGSAWIFISTILSAGLFTFVFSGVAKLSSGGTPYFAFAFAGLIGWNLFSDTLSNAAASLNANSTLISKIYFPRLILPLSTFAAIFVELAINLVIMVSLLLAYGLGFSVHLLLLPLWLLMAMTLATGAGLMLTAMSVKFRDINSATPALLSLFLYITPVAYPVADIPSRYRDILLLNPAATLIEGCRWSILGHGYLTGWAIIYSAFMTVGVFLVGLLVFARLEFGFADVI